MAFIQKHINNKKEKEKKIRKRKKILRIGLIDNYNNITTILPTEVIKYISLFLEEKSFLNFMILNRKIFKLYLKWVKNIEGLNLSDEELLRRRYFFILGKKGYKLKKDLEDFNKTLINNNQNFLLKKILDSSYKTKNFYSNNLFTYFKEEKSDFIEILLKKDLLIKQYAILAKIFLVKDDFTLYKDSEIEIFIKNYHKEVVKTICLSKNSYLVEYFNSTYKIKRRHFILELLKEDSDFIEYFIKTTKNFKDYVFIVKDNLSQKMKKIFQEYNLI